MTKSNPRPRFDLVDLQLYVAVVNQGSLSKAAASLPLALSAASARLKSLEQGLNVQLLTRSARGMKVSDAGRLFYEHAQRLLRLAQDAQEGMNALSGKGRIALRLCCNTTGISTDLPARLGVFLRSQPNIDVQFEQMPSREVVKAVASGAADVGVVDAHYEKEDLLYLLYQQNELVVVVHPEHPFAINDSCRFSDYLGQALVGLHTNSSLQQFIERMSLLAHQAARFRVRAPSFNALAQLVAQQLGLAIMPQAAATRYAAALPLKLIRLEEPWAVRELNICVRPQNNNRMPALLLARHLASLELQT